jgi:adenylate cyclase
MYNHSSILLLVDSYPNYQLGIEIMAGDTKEVKELKTQNLIKSNSPFISMITGEKKGEMESEIIYDTDTQIKQTQNRLWKALKRRYQYDSNLEPGQNFLKSHVNSKIPLVILYVDLVGSTNLSMTIPVDKLVTIIRAFTYEMSSTVYRYGGFVLKYVGDAVIAFFPSLTNKFIVCDRAVRCGISMLTIIKNGLNPILNQYDYPDLSAKIGIDEGENIIVQYGHDEKSPLDILSYCMSVSAKMTSLTKSNNITIGDDVYVRLHPELRQNFVRVNYSAREWNYVSKRTGELYKLYTLKQ